LHIYLFVVVIKSKLFQIYSLFGRGIYFKYIQEKKTEKLINLLIHHSSSHRLIVWKKKKIIHIKSNGIKSIYLSAFSAYLWS